MNATHRLIPATAMRCIEIACRECGTRIVVSFEKPGTLFMERCPRCNWELEFDDPKNKGKKLTYKTILEKYQNFYSTVRSLGKDLLFFRVEENIAKTS